MALYYSTSLVALFSLIAEISFSAACAVTAMHRHDNEDNAAKGI